MNKVQCRVCLTMQDLDSEGNIVKHDNKYYNKSCLGEFRHGIPGTAVTPKDYAANSFYQGVSNRFEEPEVDPVIPTPLVILATVLAVLVVVVVWWL